MRIIVLPFALIAIVAGCGSEAREQGTRSVPRRDLTLANRSPDLQIVSSLETGQPQVQRQAARHPKVRRATTLPAPAPGPAPAAPATPAPVAPTSVAQPVETPEAPLNDRELLPGKTITIIPVSSGPSPGPDWTEALPPEHGRPMVSGGGGTCRGRGRGPGIGIAGVPRPVFR